MIPSKEEAKRMCRQWVINQVQERHYWDSVFDGLRLTDEESDAFFESDARREAESETQKEIIAAIKAIS